MAAILTGDQASWTPSHGVWCAKDILEHLVLAEHAGIRRIWEAADRHSTTDSPVPSPNAGLSIEEIIAKTWKPKEIAPPVATPSGEGTMQYWITAFQATRPVLEALGKRLEGIDLERVIFPHFLCGPLDARQRLEFLRFHMERHCEQLGRLRS